MGSMRTDKDLIQALDRLDGRGYKAYKSIAGAYDLGRGLMLFLDHIQGDPFASPSRFRLRLKDESRAWPENFLTPRIRKLAWGDFLIREFHQALLQRGERGKGSGKSGHIQVDCGGQEILERTASRVTGDWVEIRAEVGLPASGRRILGREAHTLLLSVLPALAHKALSPTPERVARAVAFIECAENQEFIRGQLEELDLVAFVADGSNLPRITGASDRPLPNGVPFIAPSTLAVEIPLLHPFKGRSSLRGLGIPRGLSLIVGGGYHGKSTLLKALERGVYPHILGDGREYVVTRSEAVKIRAEDGRGVEGVDISGFINHLPAGRSTTAFCSEDASGSTSQAANIVEALETGSDLLLLDEDTSATNFMVRDTRMQALVESSGEPITPFVDRVGELYSELGVSTVLVMGGCGDYFDLAHTVIRMNSFLPSDATQAAQKVARENPSGRKKETSGPLTPPPPRIPLSLPIGGERGHRSTKIQAKGLDLILLGKKSLDLRGLEQLVDSSQTRAIARCLALVQARFVDGTATLREIITALDQELSEKGLDRLDPYFKEEGHPGCFARPRTQELAASLNRIRGLQIKS